MEAYASLPNFPEELFLQETGGLPTRNIGVIRRFSKSRSRMAIL
jgi:hypothetical protein